MAFLSEIFYSHVALAYVSLALLLLRGVLSAKRVDWRQYKLLKIAPHIVDTALLVSGISLFAIYLSNQIYALQDFHWLVPKLVFLVLYIVFSAKAFSKKRPFSLKNFLLAVVSFMLIMLVATVR